MPDYTEIRNRIHTTNRVLQVIPEIQQVYEHARFVVSALELYQSGTDPLFNAIADATFSGPERQELVNMLQDLNILVNDWEANHQGLLDAEIT